MAIIHSLTCTVPFSFVVPLLSLIITHSHLLSLVVTRCITHCHSLSLIVPLVVTRCTTRCHSLSFVVPLIVTPCHLLYHSLSLVVIRCHSLCHSLSLVAIRCHSMYHSSVFLCKIFQLLFFSPKHDIFIIKHTSSEMLSFLHRWDYWWKYEFNTDVKIENYYQHDGEQLGFYKKVHIKTQSRMFL